MYFRRLITSFIVLALCLSPLVDLGCAWAEGSKIDIGYWAIDAYIPGRGAAVFTQLAYPCRTEIWNTTLVSLAIDGTQGDDDSFSPSISANGRLVAFVSAADNLVAGDTNMARDIFVHDRLSRETQLVSVGLDGKPGGGEDSSISADGRFVAFKSYSSNLVIGDTNDVDDVFVRDLQSGEIERVSVASDGTQGNSWSSDPAISADGRLVVFGSWADNLVSGDTNGRSDIFVHDLESGETRRVSIASDGSQGNGNSILPSISADGRFVVFESWASNLVVGDTNGLNDFFVHNLQSGETTRIAPVSDGTLGKDEAIRSVLSADGSLVAFSSYASDLVNGDTNGEQDVFVYDRQSDEMRRVSVASDGTQGNQESFNPAFSADGHFIIFGSYASNLVTGDTNDMDDIFTHDLQIGETERVSLASDGTQANYNSHGGAISADGRFVSFNTRANNLVSGDNNGVIDVFVRDRGLQGPTVLAAFSAAPIVGCLPLTVTFTNQTAGDFTGSLWDFGDGITSTLLSPAHTYTAPGVYTITLTARGPGGMDTSLCPAYITARSDRIQLASLASDGEQSTGMSEYPSISADERFVAFASYASNLVAGDTNTVVDVFVHDLQSGETQRVSVASDGAQGNGDAYAPSISFDGRLVAFTSSAGNLVSGDTNGVADIFVRDRQSGETARLSVASDGTQGDGGSWYPAISGDGCFVAFASRAGNLVSGDSNGMKDIFVHDRRSGETRRVSVASDGTQGDGDSSVLNDAPSLSADGRLVAFSSSSSNLVGGDTNNASDIFVHDWLSGETRRVSLASDGTQADGGSYFPSLSADGRFVAFESDASNLVAGDANGVRDIFVHDLLSGETRRASVASDGTPGEAASHHPSISSDGRFVAFES